MTDLRKVRHANLEPREAALSQAERDTAGQQVRIHKATTRDAKAKESQALKDDLTGSPTDDRATGDLSSTSEKVVRDTARYEALAHEHGADLSEDGFNEALRKVSKQK